MKLSIDAEGDSLELIFRHDFKGWPKQVAPDVYVWCAEDGQLAYILVLGLSKLLGGRAPQDLDLDLTPSREGRYIEFTEEQTAKLSQKLAEHGITWPATVK